MADEPASPPTDSEDEATEEAPAKEDVDKESLSAYVSALSDAEKKTLCDMLVAEVRGEEKPMSMKDIEGMEV